MIKSFLVILISGSKTETGEVFLLHNSLKIFGYPFYEIHSSRLTE